MILTRDVIEAPQARSPGTAFADEVRAGLSRRPKSLSSAWFYDERGSRLFQRITEQDEYYLTRCEEEILRTNAGELAAILGSQPLRVIEIGAGDGDKTEILLTSLIAQGVKCQFVPIDICKSTVVDLTSRLRRNIRDPRLDVQGVVAEYFEGLSLVDGKGGQRDLVLFLGSSIGNFDAGGARRFLRHMRRSLKPGDFALIGFDLKKDLDVLQRAYDDAAGMTREFNFNLLDRINRELNGRFEREAFLHHATYNLREGCMESWLVSRREQEVWIGALSRAFSFRAWEGIQVERSTKYDLAQIEGLAAASGFEICRQWFDRRGYYVDSLWRAR